MKSLKRSIYGYYDEWTDYLESKMNLDIKLRTLKKNELQRLEVRSGRVLSMFLGGVVLVLFLQTIVQLMLTPDKNCQALEDVKNLLNGTAKKNDKISQTLDSLDEIVKTEIREQLSVIVGVIEGDKQLKIDNRALKNVNEELKRKNTDLTSSVDTHTTTIRGLEDEKFELNGKITTHLETIGKIKADLQAEKRKNTKLGKQVLGLEGEKTRFKDERDALRRNYDTQSAQLTNEVKKVGIRDRTIARTNGEISQCESDRDGFKTQMNEYHGKLFRCMQSSDDNKCDGENENNKINGARGIASKSGAVDPTREFPTSRKQVIQSFEYIADQRQKEIHSLMDSGFSEDESLKYLRSLFLAANNHANSTYTEIMSNLTDVFRSDTLPHSVDSCITPFLQGNFKSEKYFDIPMIRSEILQFESILDEDENQKYLANHDFLFEFVDDILLLNWKMILFKPQFSILVDTNNVNNLESYDKSTDIRAGSVQFHVWPGLIQEGKLEVKGEALFD